MEKYLIIPEMNLLNKLKEKNDTIQPEISIFENKIYVYVTYEGNFPDCIDCKDITQEQYNDIKNQMLQKMKEREQNILGLPIGGANE